MKDPFKNFQCTACINYSDNYCLLKKFKVRPHDLCPEWIPIWEDV